jgi:dolichol-phosphate mannosyltransferase
MALRTSKPLVLIPTYNESESIIQIIDEIFSITEEANILVIDDASLDGTADLIKSHWLYGIKLQLIERASKLGLGTAYREGFRWGLEREYDVFVQIDADHSHDPKDIPSLLEEIEKGADVAVGSRYLNGVRVLNWPITRLMMSAFAGFYTRVLTCLPLTDPTSGFKAIYKDALFKLPWERFTTGGYSFQIELHFYLWQTGAKLQEVPIIFTERNKGASKMSRAIALEAALRVPKLAIEKILF